MREKYCRFCGNTNLKTFVDLGMSPLSNAYVAFEQLETSELFYPLHAFVCDKCFLVQLPVFETPQNIFEDYFYLSSYSSSWLDHAKRYVDTITQKRKLNKDSFVIEIASNDGYLLKNFTEKEIPVLGIEPAKNIAKIANEKGILTISEFFSEKFAHKLCQEGKKADLIIANNVLAHVPDINNFVLGIYTALKHEGVVTVEFPSLLNLIKLNQFDTIYHEHFSYLSFSVVYKIFEAHNLKIYDVEKLETHGGSLRVYACRKENDNICISENVEKILEEEQCFGINDMKSYINFSYSVKKAKRDILKTLISLKEEGNQIIAYGAPAKGNTLLNYCGIREDFFDYVVDLSSYKQGKFLPGTHLPILHPDEIMKTKPNYIFISPWNLKDEIMEQLKYVKQWECKFIIPIPYVEVI